jgi:hypothetical protein
MVSGYVPGYRMFKGNCQLDDNRQICFDLGSVSDAFPVAQLDPDSVSVFKKASTVGQHDTPIGKSEQFHFVESRVFSVDGKCASQSLKSFVKEET